MNRLIKYIIPVFVTLFCLGHEANGQVAVPENWDQDIYALRHAAVPGFNVRIDDYMQYAPAAVMLTLKACGNEGRSDWAQMLVADAFSVASMTLFVRGIKAAVDRTRPNMSGKSFPSGHTATAFMTATMLHMEYGWKNPWWSIGSYSVAAVTGVFRILNNWHWMSDVATGAFKVCTPVAGLNHILLIDDVFTTGSTLHSCFLALREVYPFPIRISVATLGFVGG